MKLSVHAKMVGLFCGYAGLRVRKDLLKFGGQNGAVALDWPWYAQDVDGVCSFSL